MHPLGTMNVYTHFHHNSFNIGIVTNTMVMLCTATLLAPVGVATWSRLNCPMKCYLFLKLNHEVDICDLHYHM